MSVRQEIAADDNEVRTFECRQYSVRPYTRASRRLVDVKPHKETICSSRFEREIILVRL